MQFLLSLSRLIDRVNQWVGRSVTWLILIMALISTGNAVIRKAFDYSSNAFLEIQWYLFATVFMLAAGYTLLRNEHVRIDIIAGRFSPRTHAWIDIFGTLIFLMPMAILTLYLSWPFVVNSYSIGEMSSNPGGLIRWPVKILVPIGFSLLIAQGFSELIKRIAFLLGLIDNPVFKHEGPSAEEELAAAILAQSGKSQGEARK